MGTRRVRWAANLPDGTPILIAGVLADVDDVTGVVSLSDRVCNILAEVLDNNPQPLRTEQIPAIDLAREVYRLVQAKHAAGVRVHSPLPKKDRSDAAIQRSVDR